MSSNVFVAVGQYLLRYVRHNLVQNRVRSQQWPGNLEDETSRGYLSAGEMSD